MYAGPVSKRDRLAGWLAASGLLRLAEYLPQRECLVVVNYHRVGDREATPYDPGVYSATPELFEEQIRFLRRRLRPVALEEAAAFLAGRLRLGRAGVLVTFDDGYLDNYTTAFPLLRRHGVPAVFFLPTAFIGTGRLAWWDAIAYLVKHGPPRFAVEYPAPAAFDVAAEGLDRVLLRLYRTYKLPETMGERFVEEVRRATGGGAVPQERLFMNWEEAAAMRRGGMAVGSHTHTHALLAKLPPESQRDEMACSKAIIERELGVPCEALAYPYGLPSSIGSETPELARQAGYRLAFSFHGGVNRAGTDPYRLQRSGPSAETGTSRFRMQTLTAAVSGRYSY